MSLPNQWYEGKKPWEVPTIHERILRHSDQYGVAAGASHDDAQGGSQSWPDIGQYDADKIYERNGSYEQDFRSDYLPAWDDPDEPDDD